MTLQEWAKNTNTTLHKTESGCMIIVKQWLPNRTDLWRLSDYIVSSISGGCIYLMPKS